MSTSRNSLLNDSAASSAKSPMPISIHGLSDGGAQVVEAISALCTESSRDATAYKVAARTAGDSLKKVIETERDLQDAAISLGQEELLSDLIAELERVMLACRECEGVSVESTGSSRVSEAPNVSRQPALPQWWFALSEMLQTTDREIALLKTIGCGQPRNSPARQMCNIVVRVLRRHYQRMLLEAEAWMSLSNV